MRNCIVNNTTITVNFKKQRGKSHNYIVSMSMSFFPIIIYILCNFFFTLQKYLLVCGKYLLIYITNNVTQVL